MDYDMNAEEKVIANFSEAAKDAINALADMAATFERLRVKAEEDFRAEAMLILCRQGAGK